jgi:hypothetical protein
MSCEKYKPDLIEAAITGAEPAPAIREHIESCARCADEITQQRSLIAAIDASVYQSVNAPLPPALLQRFEARLAQENPPRSLNLSWLYAAAALATASALILFALSHSRAHNSSSPSAVLVQSAQSATEHRLQIVPLVLEPETPEERRRVSHRARPVAAPQPEVLVPPDERIALAHFMADADGRGDLATALARQVPQQDLRVAPLDVPDIQTASLTVAPIQESTAVTNR